MNNLKNFSVIEGCQKLMERMSLQDRLYQPSCFWLDVSKNIIIDLEKHGFDAFRSLNFPLWNFVPTYGFPGNSLSESMMNELSTIINQPSISDKQRAYLDQFISGYSSALADYRTFSAIEYRNHEYPNLMCFSESNIGAPKEHFEIENKFYSRSSLNYLMGLAFLKQHIDLKDVSTILEIGGGFGTLGEIIHKTMQNTNYINIDIPPTICCASYYLSNIVGKDRFTDYEDVANRAEISLNELKEISVLPSWTIENLKGKVDLFVNYISFQEMEHDIVQNYLIHVKRLGAEWVLLRNMREGKQLRTDTRHGVDSPILSKDYIAMLDGYELIDNNVIPFGFKTVDGFHSELMLFRRKCN
jgi:putative sugar O-methyltransferase